MIEGGVVPAPVRLHLGDIPLLVARLQIAFVCAGHHAVQKGELAIYAVGGSYHLKTVNCTAN